jgi:large subunit ribosomal protein L33
MAKSKKKIITLECTEARKEGVPPSRYTTTKNTQTHPERLEKKKYNPWMKKHTVHREIK